MTRTANANWNAQIAAGQQAPVYFLRIDGMSKDYSTTDVQNVGTPKTVLMDVPTGGGGSVDLVAGAYTVQDVRVKLLDVAAEITDLVSTEAAGAVLSTLVNRKATIYGGFRPLDEADYEVMFTGRIRGVRMGKDLNAFEFTLASIDYLLDAEIMADATATTPCAIRGNIVNVYWSILTGTFDTGHATFPLDFVSTATSTTSAPTGLDIATTLINETQLVEQRDTWHANDKAHVVFSEPENAQEHLKDELFRMFQAFPARSADGLLGLHFHVPSLPLSSAPEITSDHIVEVVKWERMYGDHLNKFVIMGDYSVWSEEYETELYATGDTTDQTATAETIEYYAESRWIRTDYDGVEIAWELAERMKIRYVKPPAKIEMTVLPSKLALEEGDVVKVTDVDIPDLILGTRGIEEHMMTILAIRPDWTTGLLRLTLLDTGGKRYGLITGNAQADYAAATNEDKETFFFISDNAGAMSDATDGYRFI